MDFHAAICMDRTARSCGVLAGAPDYVAAFFPALERIAKDRGFEVAVDTLGRLAGTAAGDDRLTVWQYAMLHAALLWLGEEERRKPGTVTAIFGRDPRDPR